MSRTGIKNMYKRKSVHVYVDVASWSSTRIVTAEMLAILKLLTYLLST